MLDDSIQSHDSISTLPRVIHDSTINYSNIGGDRIDTHRVRIRLPQKNVTRNTYSIWLTICLIWWSIAMSDNNSNIFGNNEHYVEEVDEVDRVSEWVKESGETKSLTCIHSFTRRLLMKCRALSLYSTSTNNNKNYRLSDVFPFLFISVLLEVSPRKSNC